MQEREGYNSTVVVMVWRREREGYNGSVVVVVYSGGYNGKLREGYVV